MAGPDIARPVSNRDAFVDARLRTNFATAGIPVTAELSFSLDRNLIGSTMLSLSMPAKTKKKHPLRDASCFSTWQRPT
ncbi:hypothetical protein, partial [Cohnella laeviribosi]|uniref:hypothetical protein n=1 Tax=Cohnella laeviribosi TaxID=380174 RepID=UPI003D1E4B8E